MIGSDDKRLNAVETDNARLMPLLAEQGRDNAVIRDVLRKNRRRTSPPRSGARHNRSGPERALLTGHCGYERAPIATRNAQIATWNATHALWTLHTATRATEPQAGAMAISGRMLTGDRRRQRKNVPLGDKQLNRAGFVGGYFV